MTDDKPTPIQQVLDLIDDADGKFLEIGSVLRQLKEDNPAAFAAVIEAPGLGRRRVYYLVRISKAFDDKPHLHERLRRLGWTKAELLSPYASTEPFDELLNLAEEVTAHELKAFMKDGAAGLGAGLLTFALPAAAYAKVTKVLKAYGAYQTPHGLRNKEQALLGAMSSIAET
jgi:hypothetical protein